MSTPLTFSRYFTSLTTSGLLLLSSTSVFAQNTFISSRPGAHTGTPIMGTLPSEVPEGAIVLQGSDHTLPRETRNRTCRDIYGAPAPEVTYSGGPILEVRYETRNGEFSAWQREGEFSCLRHHEYERTTTQCQRNQRGIIREQRKYDVTDDNVVINDTDWQIIENTCAYYFIKAESEFKHLTCPTNQQGWLIEKRSYDLWSDGSKRNYGPWTQSVNTCAWFLVGKATETRNGTCPTNMQGEVKESRTYEIW